VAKVAAGLGVNSVGKERCGVPSRPVLALGWVVGKGGRRRLVRKRSTRKSVIEPGAESGYAWAAANPKGLGRKEKVQTEGNTALRPRGTGLVGEKLLQVGRCRLGGDDALSERMLEIRPIQVQDLEGDEHANSQEGTDEYDPPAGASPPLDSP